MRAIVLEKCGGPDFLKLAETAAPSVEPGHVVVAVFSLPHANLAHEASYFGHSRGRVVIEVRP
jgi:NADPH:quinone reductase-like Zn-dependent oxidoreductase